MPDNLNKKYYSTYNLPYQFIIRAKVFFGRKILNYKNREMNHIIDFIQNNRNDDSILDIGCSTGHMVEAMSTRFGPQHVHGADIHINSVERNRIVFKQNQFHHIRNGFYKENEKKYSAITLMHVLEHVDHPSDLLSNIKNLLTENGILALSVPQERLRGDLAIPENIFNIMKGDFTNVHVRKYSFDSVKKDIEAAGLNIIDHKYIHQFYPNKNQKSFANYSLILFIKKIKIR